MFIPPSQPLAVGAIADSKTLASCFTRADCDWVELRLDSLGSGPDVMAFCERHNGQLPLLMTARDPAQGGVGNLSLDKREKLLRALLPYASAVDIEFANFAQFAPLLADVLEKGLGVVASHHDFVGFDDSATLQVLQAAQREDHIIAKGAVTLREASDLSRFDKVAAEVGGSRFAFMGMGPYGPASRLIAAQHGSLLNYGFLGEEPTAPGQWPVALLKQVLAVTPRQCL